MKYYIGIDLGTSSLKGILINKKGNIIKEESSEYPVIYPQKGWTEQNPQEWINALEIVLSNIVNGYESDIEGIAVTGQMHGLVVLDENNNIIRNCILWNDARSYKQSDFLNEIIGKETLFRLTGNISFAGFTAPKILWLKENEPDNFNKISHILLPKDFITYYLCGKFVTDYSDASGTLLLDVEHKCWSKEMCDICGIKKENLPMLHESYDVIGCINGNISQKYCLSNKVKVITGASDNAAAAIGTNTINNYSCNISIGTSGTIFIALNDFTKVNQYGLHTFAHANGRWHLLGCILAAASCRKWWIEDIIENYSYDKDEESINNIQTDDLIFLPYLSGIRSPYNDTLAKGAFVGLTMTTTKAQMSKAIMEGVVFAIKDCLEIAKQSGIKPNITSICGGGVKSKIWKQIFADVLNMPVETLLTEQGPSYGAAILAMVGCGEYSNLYEANNEMIKVNETIYPIKNNVILYEKKYTKYNKLYLLLKELY